MKETRVWTADPDLLIASFRKEDSGLVGRFHVEEHMERTAEGVRYMVAGSSYAGLVEAEPAGGDTWRCRVWVTDPTFELEQETSLLAVRVLAATDPPQLARNVTPEAHLLYRPLTDTPGFPPFEHVPLVLQVFTNLIMESLGQYMSSMVTDRTDGLVFTRALIPYPSAYTLHGYALQGFWHELPVQFVYHRTVAWLKIGVQSDDDPVWSTIIPISSAVPHALADDVAVLQRLLLDDGRQILTRRELLAVFTVVANHLNNGSPSHLFLLESVLMGESVFVTCAGDTPALAEQTIRNAWHPEPIKLTYFREQVHLHDLALNFSVNRDSEP